MLSDVPSAVGQCNLAQRMQGDISLNLCKFLSVPKRIVAKKVRNRVLTRDLPSLELDE